MTANAERRRGRRVRAELMVAVRGVDSGLRRRAANVSECGLYLEHEQFVGAVGTVQWLELDTLDGHGQVGVLARVARSMILTDADHDRPMVGVGLELMPESAQTRVAVERLVRRLGVVPVDLESLAALGGAEPAPTHGLEPLAAPFGVQRIVLDVDRAFEVGEAIDFQISPVSGGSGTFRGEVFRVRPSPGSDGVPRFRVEVEVGMAEGAKDLVPDGRWSFLDAADIVFDELEGRRGGDAPGREHLSGQLARIGLPALLGMCEMERLSGLLKIDGPRFVRVYLRHGNIVDVDTDLQNAWPSPRAALAEIIGWTSGTFDFLVGEVDRPDRIEQRTTTLLIELAHHSDESKRA